MTSGNEDLPPVVTFTEGAALLDELGIAPGMTSDRVRYKERHPDWPFGPGRPHAYGKVANAKTMTTEPFLAFFRAHPPGGRGPDKKPRKKRGDTE